MRYGVTILFANGHRVTKLLTNEELATILAKTADAIRFEPESEERAIDFYWKETGDQSD